jgi:hypothetical protein
VTVELHGYGGDYEGGSQRRSPVWDVTSLAGDVSYTHTTRGGQAQLTLYIPIREWGGQPPVIPGTWLVIRDDSDTRDAHWWGRVVNVSSGREVAAEDSLHGVTTVAVNVTAQTWEHMLSSARVILAAGMRGVRVPGAVFQFDTWGDGLTAWMAKLNSNRTNPGELLREMFKELARQTLPISLGSEPLGDAVPVVWTAEQAPAALQRRFVPVPGWAIQATGNMMPSGTVWSMLQGTFSADPQLVELFPGTYGGLPSTALEEVLGVRVPLVYRMVPLHPDQAVFGTGAIESGLFGEKPEGWAYHFKASEVLNWSVSWSDDDRQNGFFAETFLQPQSQMGAYGILGTPIIQSEDAHRHGLRFYEASWPFFPSASEEGGGGVDIRSRIDAIVEYAAHGLQDGHLKGSGQLSVKANPHLRPGQWVTAEVSDGDEVWSCYLTSVTHSVRVNPRTKVRTDTTTANYTQGIFGQVGKATPQREPGTYDAADLDLRVIA